MRALIKRLLGWTSKREPVMGYGATFTGPLATWQESQCPIVSIEPFPEPEDDDPFVDEDEDAAFLMHSHNPEELGFPTHTARFRVPDLRCNDLLIYSESSQSYVTIKRFEHPQATAEVVMRMRDGWTFAEATRGH